MVKFLLVYEGSTPVVLNVDKRNGKDDRTLRFAGLCYHRSEMKEKEDADEDVVTLVKCSEDVVRPVVSEDDGLNGLKWNIWILKSSILDD